MSMLAEELAARRVPLVVAIAATEAVRRGARVVLGYDATLFFAPRAAGRGGGRARGGRVSPQPGVDLERHRGSVGLVRGVASGAVPRHVLLSASRGLHAPSRPERDRIHGPLSSALPALLACARWPVSPARAESRWHTQSPTHCWTVVGADYRVDVHEEPARGLWRVTVRRRHGCRWYAWRRDLVAAQRAGVELAEMFAEHRRQDGG